MSLSNTHYTQVKAYQASELMYEDRSNGVRDML